MPRPPRRYGRATHWHRSRPAFASPAARTRPIVTDGPFAEGAEVAGGYYVFEAENLDEALALARDIPAAKYGGVEVWPMVHFSPARAPLTSDSWLALLLEPPGATVEPGTPQWDEGIKAHRSSARSPATARWAAPRCTRRRRRRRCGFAMARCC